MRPIGIAVIAVGTIGSISDPPPYLIAVVGVSILVDVLSLLYRLNTGAVSHATESTPVEALRLVSVCGNRKTGIVGWVSNVFDRLDRE
jgi:hypothetical protein